jgi:hypothetical protein
MSEKEIRAEIKELTKQVNDNHLTAMTEITRLSTQMEPVAAHFARLAVKAKHPPWYTSKFAKVLAPVLATLITALVAFLSQ